MENNKNDWFNHQINILKSLGIVPIEFSFLPPKLRFLRKIFNLLFVIFWYFTLVHIAICQLVSLALNFATNDDDPVDFVMEGSIYAYAILIITFWLYNHKKLLKLIDFIYENFRLRSSKGLTYVSIEESILTGKKYFNWWVFSCLAGMTCLAGTMAWVVYPLLQCYNCRMLPLKSWYPVDVKLSPWYELAFIFQAFGQFYIGTGYGICLGINLTMVYMLFGQIDMLNASLKNLGTVTSSDGTKDFYNFSERQNVLKKVEQELNQYATSTEKFDSPPEKSDTMNVKDALLDCMEHHFMILDFFARLEDLFRWFLFTKLFQGGFLVCVCAYSVSTLEEFNPIKIGNLLIYVGLSGSELLLYNFVGELIKQYSSRSGEALMRSDWYTFDVSIQRSMIIFIANAIRPIELTAGVIYKVNIETFRSVAGIAFSFFTLLKEMKQKSRV